MFRLRLTVTQLRVLILGANIVLTGAVGAHVYYRYANEYAMPGNVDPEMSRTPEEFKSKGTGVADGTNQVLRVAGTASGFIEQRREVVAVPPPTQPPNPEIVEPVEGILPPGPLEEGWEYDGHIGIGGAGGMAWGIIRRKTAAGPTAITGGPRVITNVRSTPRIVRSPTAIPGRRNPATAQPIDVRMLTAGDWFPLEEEGEGPIIKVLEITEAQFVYAEHGKPHRYALQRKRHLPIIYDPQGNAKMNPELPEPDPSNPEPPPEEDVRYFVVGDPPTAEERLKEYLDRQGGGAAAGAAGAKGLRPSDGAAPKTQAEQLQQLRSTIQQIPEAERKKVEDILRKPRTIQQK